MRFRGDSDYEPVKRPGPAVGAANAVEPVWLPKSSASKYEFVPDQSGHEDSQTDDQGEASGRPAASLQFNETWSTTKGHAVTFVALFVYVSFAYFRPFELTNSLSWTIALPYWLALAMLLIFIPSQFAAEGTLTARPKEVNLILLLGLIAVISMVKAIDRAVAWDIFYTIYIKTIIVFIVMVNCLRTKWRLRAMILLALAAGAIMSITALKDYSAGSTGGYVGRAATDLSNMFGEPNSLALHLAIMIPIALVLSLSSSNAISKLVYLATAVVMIAGVFATFSRGGFLALVAVGLFLAWKLGKRNRFAILGIIILAALAAIFLAPGGYGARIGSIFYGDAEGSASARQALLTRSVWVALTSPFLGVGIGNLRVVLIHDQVSHNAYTQVGGDMGLIALTLYLMFLIIPFKRLAVIERETLQAKQQRRDYYLAVGLQGALVAYLVGSFFLSVAYDWFGYFVVAYAVSFRRLYLTKPRETKASDDFRTLKERGQ